MKILAFISLLLLLLAACAKSTSGMSSPPEPIWDKMLDPENTPTVPVKPSQIPVAIPTKAPLPTAAPEYQPTLLPAPKIYNEPGPLYDTILQIPVSKEGIQYRGAGVPDMQPVGPNGLVITRDGTIVIGDVFGNRLMRYDFAGNRLGDIDLTALGILNISDLVGIGNALYILEISFSVLPERYRVNQLTTEGQLISQYDLPKGYHFEDGLYGLAVGYPAGGEPEILFQLGNADDSQYFQVPRTPEDAPERLSALPLYSEKLRVQSGREAELALLSSGTRDFESQMTLGGSIFLLSARDDGSLYLERDDLVAWEPITTDITIHYILADGTVMGVARYPIKDWYFYIWRYLTVGPDGNTYGLITREQSVDVLRLNFYKSLEPLIKGAIEPTLKSLPVSTQATLAYDCSIVRHIATESTEASQIASSVIANYQQDRPTEYLAFEQLWSVDVVKDYAILEGMVTVEETDIIIAQKTERGYVMVAWYIGQLPTPGLRHGDIRGYFAAQLPQAPAELFYCLDISRFSQGGL